MSEQVDYGMKIVVSELLGEYAMTMTKGFVLHEKLLKYLKAGYVIELDFRDCKVISTPFLNASIGKLLGEFSAEQIKSDLKITNCPDYSKRLINLVFDNALKFYKEKKANENA